MLLKMLRGEVWPTPTGRERRTSSLEKEQIAYGGPERQDKYIRYDWNLTVTQVVTTGLFDEDIPLTAADACSARTSRARVEEFWFVGIVAAAHSAVCLTASDGWRWSRARLRATRRCCCWMKCSMDWTCGRRRS